MDDDRDDGGELHPPLTADSIMRLIPDVMEKIFGHLDVRSKGRVAQVCMAWRDIVYLRSVWYGVCVPLQIEHPDHRLLLPSLSRRSIRYFKIRDIEVDALHKLLHQEFRLEEIEVCNIAEKRICDSVLELAFIFEFPHLVHLSLNYCDITDKGVTAVIQQCLNLVFLDLTGCCRLTDDCLLPVGRHLAKLRTLLLNDIPNIGKVGVNYITGADPQVATGNLNLEFLCIQGCRGVDDVSIQYIVNALGQLTSLHFGVRSAQQLVTDTNIQAISNMQSLRELLLYGWDNVTDVGLGHLARMTNLQVLILFGRYNFADTVIAKLSEGGCRIVELRLAYCYGLTDVGMHHISQLTELRHLELFMCHKVSDVGLSAFSAGEPKLVSLTCIQCKDLTNECMMCVAKMTQLREFRCFNSRIGDRGLLYLVDGGSQLRRLDMAFTEVTDFGVQELARMQYLRVLNVYSCRCDRSDRSYVELKDLFDRRSTITSIIVDRYVKDEATKAGKSQFIRKRREYERTFAIINKMLRDDFV